MTMGVPSRVLADDQNPNDYLHSRTYIGVLGTSVSASSTGAFKGNNYSISYNTGNSNSNYEITLLPSIAQNFGYGLLIGHREDAYALELSYWQSNHTTSFGPATLGAAPGSGFSSSSFTSTVTDQAVYNAVNLDFKRYFLTEMQFQPFIDLGVSFPWFTLSDGAGDSNGNVLSATLAGLGLNLGLGVEYYLTPNISFVAGGYQRWASFDQFRSFGSSYTNLSQYGTDNSNEGGGLMFEIGTTVGLQ